MASDKSDPRVGLILQVGVLAIVTLLATRAVLQAYFDRAERAELQRKNVGPEALLSVRADEKQRLSTGAMPIDKAMQTMVTKGRLNASPDIMPSASKDVAPLQGWTKLPGEVPPAMTAPPPPPPPEPPPSTSASAAPSAAPAGSQKPKQP
jgi:hypothetical protein